MSDRSNKDRAYVARGATLYTPKSSKKDKEKKKLYSSKDFSNTNITIKSKQIKDPKNEEAVIRKLEAAGIEVKQYKKRYLLRRIKARISKLNLDSYAEYLDVINTSKQEVKELHESLSINVTRFFRNRDTFETIRDEILPVLVKNAKANNKSEIKIWSAGCAVGAEPYSLAMLASDVVPSSITVRIIASDIKDELINIARYATYSDQYVAEMHPFEINNYFNLNQHGEYIVKPHIKRMVNFTNIDLMKDSYPGGLDLILCRNVLIYIDREAQNEIMSGFFKSLRDGGMVILGRTETLFVDWRKHIKIISTKHRIYQKIGITPDSLPSLDFVEKPKRKLGVTTSHQKRLEDLKNFRQTYEDRRKQWEKRIQDIEIKNEDLKTKSSFDNNSFSKNKVSQFRKTSSSSSISTAKKTPFKKQSLQGGLSTFRQELKQNPKIKPHTMESLVNKRTPEEAYNELKKLREKKKKEKKF